MLRWVNQITINQRCKVEVVDDDDDDDNRFKKKNMKLLKKNRIEETKHATRMLPIESEQNEKKEEDKQRY